MSYASPSPPETLPDDAVETLDTYSPDLLRDVTQYAEKLAEHREREARLEEQDEQNDRTQGRSEELPDDVPSKATITIKEINDNRYYYWQWRDGEKIRSKYKSPVNRDE
ncbi:hypothetical protein ACFO5R_00315 [Halosolutus amylolyticus]|uniref:DUF6788 domain-containing protein n=1 Tax=Halosolutus amylolyticus TaxID=2932267 RepID=A0ABD5PIL7_9EURY|nr:hypothetical protein [Halosolutus amylolyticus]